jgi:hypothetical protein
MIVSVFVRRLKPGATFQDFVREWEADEGFGVPTRVFNAQSLTDPREIISIGPVAVTAEQVTQSLATARHPKLRGMSGSIRSLNRPRCGACTSCAPNTTSRTCPGRSTSGPCEPAGRTDLWLAIRQPARRRR